MDKNNYDSYCGIYCGACDIMLSHKTGQKQPLASFWNEANVKTFQKKVGDYPENNDPLSYECHGCKSGQVFINCQHCRIRKCAVQKEVEHCIDCPEYPCEYITVLKKSEKVLPHLKMNHANMETVKEVGVSQWLLQQENKWKCTQCQSTVSWYMKKCSKCGMNLKGKSLVFPLLQRTILKIGILLIPDKK